MSKNERTSGTPTFTPVPSTPKVMLKPASTGSHKAARGESGSRTSTPLPGVQHRWRRGRKWVKRMVNVPTIDGSFQTLMWVAEEAGVVPQTASLHNPENAITADFRPRPGVNPVTQRPVYQLIQQTPSRGIPPSPSPTPQTQSGGTKTKSVAGAEGVGTEGGKKSGFKIIIRKESLRGVEIGEEGVKEEKGEEEEKEKANGVKDGSPMTGEPEVGDEGELSREGLIGDGGEEIPMDTSTENDNNGGVVVDSEGNLAEIFADELVESGAVVAGGEEGEEQQGVAEEGGEGMQMHLDSESEVDVL